MGSEIAGLGLKTAGSAAASHPAVTVTRAVREVERLVEEGYAPGKDRFVAWVMGGVPAEILQCFDIHAVFPEQYGTLCAMKGATHPFIDYAETDGFSSRVCGYLRVALGYARTLAGRAPAAEAAYGGMPRPDMLLGISRLCDPRSKVFEAMRRYLSHLHLGRLRAKELGFRVGASTDDDLSLSEIKVKGY